MIEKLKRQNSKGTDVWNSVVLGSHPPLSYLLIDWLVGFTLPPFGNGVAEKLHVDLTNGLHSSV